MPLTPEDVQNKRFTTTRFRPGYDEDEVDAFLDEVENELSRLLQENSQLRGRGGAAQATAPPAAPAEVAEAPAPAAEPEGGQEAALKTLLLAQRTADEAIGQARKEAEQIVADARARASTMEQEARDKHAAAMAELERRRRELERAVEDLRAFEREYRTRLKAYLETQLRDLEGRVVVSEAAAGPRPATPPSAPPASGAPSGAAGGAPAGPAGGAPTAPPRPGVPGVAPAGGPGGAQGGSGTPPVSPFGPAPTFNRPDSPATAPAGPPQEADVPPGMEVDEGPEIPPASG